MDAKFVPGPDRKLTSVVVVPGAADTGAAATRGTGGRSTSVMTLGIEVHSCGPCGAGTPIGRQRFRRSGSNACYVAASNFRGTPRVPATPSDVSIRMGLLLPAKSPVFRSPAVVWHMT